MNVSGVPPLTLERTTPAGTQTSRMLIHDVSKVLWIWFAIVNGSSGGSPFSKPLYWNPKRLLFWAVSVVVVSPEVEVSLVGQFRTNQAV